MKVAHQKPKAKIARLFQNGGSQAVRLPKEYRFESDRVEIIREGEKLIITPINARKSWAEYFKTAPSVDDDFLMDIDDMPPAEVSVFDE
ncbi:hypothetical protein MNBD_GAMMA11-1843 [hydrothermal vent metagenome]|uniref:SpoVT-AbrB domain-containing protein n=1 Tax=hydrothermal vent metagenome TaxID=652676 RepID=A0A3B0XGH5_9ZZZZ